MLMMSSGLKVWVSSHATDMRKGCFSLAVLVQQSFKLEPRSQNLFVFFSRKCDRVKILYWDRNGFALWYKCLAKGRYRPPKMDGARYSISQSDLNLLLEGIDLTHEKRLNIV